MKLNARNLIAGAMAGVMSLALLAGCGGSSTSTAAPAASGSAAPAAAAAAPAAAAPADDGKVYTWRLQNNYALDSAEGRMAENVKYAIEKATNGRVQVELYEPGALCSAADIVTYLSQDAFDCAVIFGSTYSGVIPEADLGCGIPFAWETVGEVYDAMEVYGLKDVIQEAYGEYGIKYYWNVHEPNYNTLTNFEVNSVADYAGKKIRALGVWGDYYAAIGASPVNIPGTEVYQALQLGTIDGAHYGWSALSDANNIREVTKYAIHPSLCYCQMATLVSENSLNALPEDLRNAVDIALEEANMGSVSLAHIAETEQSVRAAVNGGYIEIVDLPEEVVAELREIAVTQVWEALAAKSDRMAKGIEIIKQQSRDYGRQVDY